MQFTFALLIILAFLKNVYSIIYFIDLENKHFTDFCHSIRRTSDVSTCTIHFKSGDTLDIFRQKELIWFSQKHYKLDSLVIISKSDQPQLFHITYKNSNTDEVKNVYYQRKDDTFSEICVDEYYNTYSKLKDTCRKFDVNFTYESWFLTDDDGVIKTHYIEPTMKVLQVVDGNKTIWNNEKSSLVAAIKVSCGKEGPEICEIFTRDNVNETRHIYTRDDSGWNFISATKCLVEESKLKIPFSEHNKNPKKERKQRKYEYTEKDDENTDTEEKTGDKDVKEEKLELDKEEKEDAESKKIEEVVVRPKTFKRPGKYELVISLDENHPHKIPNYVDIGDYMICGFNTRIYECTRSTVTRVSDGSKLLWHKTDDTYLEMVTVLQSLHSEQLLVEIKYIVRSDKDLGVVKGLKQKHWMNIHYYDYDYFVQTKGVWESVSKVDFSILRQKLINDYMFKNRNRKFDSSVKTFFDDVSDTPLENLDTRKNISYKNLKEYWKTRQRRKNMETISITYNLKIDPQHVFDVKPHSIYQNFIFCELGPPYGVSKFMDGDQVIWNQSENGIGLFEFYYYIGKKLQTLHLIIDGKHDKNKYYHKRKGYWYCIEEEEYMKLLNNNLKMYKNTKLIFKDNTYTLVDSDDKEKSSKSKNSKS